MIYLLTLHTSIYVSIFWVSIGSVIIYWDSIMTNSYDGVIVYETKDNAS